MAIQHGQAIFNLSASFHVTEESFDHQDPMPEGLPQPEDLPSFAEQYAAWGKTMGDDWLHNRPFDSRNCDWGPRDRLRNLPPHQRIWLRADGTLPDDPVLHACLVTYVSDMTLLDTSLLPHGSGYFDPKVMMASLDHAMWFHRPFRADDWLLYAQETPSAHGARGFARGSIFTRDGSLAVSVVQEGLVRRIR